MSVFTYKCVCHMSVTNGCQEHGFHRWVNQPGDSTPHPNVHTSRRRLRNFTQSFRRFGMQDLTRKTSRLLIVWQQLSGNIS